MTEKKDSHTSIQEPPRENFARGLRQVDLPSDFGTPIQGKVRDSWVVERGNEKLRVMVTTDRQSAFDRDICTVPEKGQVLNLISAFWFGATRNIVPNHMLSVPQSNVLIARQAESTLPVELIFRRFMARSSTTTSVYRNYAEGRREIYGIKFPDGLQPNQDFPMGTISTPTTKAESGQHDIELTDEEARDLVDKKLGNGTWKKAKTAGLALFELGLKYHMQKGLILADTKYEFGIDKNGELMLIDEIHTPDSSRFWLGNTYKRRFSEGKNPDSFDKEILRAWLANRGFTGEGIVPVVDSQIIDMMSSAYKVPYDMITSRKLPNDSQSTSSDSVRQEILRHFFILDHGGF